MKETDRESEPCRHDDVKLPRIIVTFDSPHMTQEIGFAEVDLDGTCIVGVDYGINLISKRIDIVRVLEEIIATIKSTPEVKR